MNYTNREVVRRLKQYDMFLNSLKLTNDETQKERICDQLDKIEKQILLETNTEYEEEYTILFEKESKLIMEEKEKLNNLIKLITERKNYLNERKNNHQKVTGSLVELTTFLGEDKLNDFKERLRIIEKYEQNKIISSNIIKELKSLDVRISEASRNVKANSRLNESLENKMKEKVEDALESLDLFSLTNQKDEIINKQKSLEYALDMAKNNLKSARSLGQYVLECDNMLSEIMLEYSKYNEKLNIIKLIDTYGTVVGNYEEILEKRNKIDEILKNIQESDLYKLINEELSKQYNTIKLQGNDIKTYESLKEERELKNKILYEIEEENNSKAFNLVLNELRKNEARLEEEKKRIAKKKEYDERQKRILEQQKIEAARVQRQRLIEEEKLKEQMLNTEKLRSIQEKSVLSSIKEEKEDNEENNNELIGNIIDKSIEEEPKEEFVPVDLDNDNLFNETVSNLDSDEKLYDLLGKDNFPDIHEDTIPIIENNNLKPERIDNNKEILFPEMNKKEGEILWKETM